MAITLGLVEAVDSNGVYVSMPGSRGVLRGPYLTLQDVAVGDQVLAVTTDDGENVIVGLASAAAPRSTPASSTDNTVPRFDGTGGALQTSGVTIADNGEMVVPGNVTIQKSAAAMLWLKTSAGETYQTISPFNGSNYQYWQVNGSTRWQFRMVSGGNYQIIRHSDAGAEVSTAFQIARATGKVTLGDVGSAAGLEFGASGPTITTGTGAPSHSAPNGSVYLRQDGTASTTLYVRAAGSWSALS